MNTPNPKCTSGSKLRNNVSRWWIFPIVILVIYGLLFLCSPSDASQALRSSGNVLRTLVWPMLLVFMMIMALNLFVKPSQINRFFGRNAGVKGYILSATSGIISTGPIYAWYPLLQDLRARGAADSLIAVFLFNRAVKPFLLPVMIGYFGWKYVVILTILMVLGSFAVGYCMTILMKEEQGLCDQ